VPGYHTWTSDYGRTTAISAACIGKLREVLVYQPASRYWAFQWYEMAIFIGLAVVLGGICLWWIRRRIALER